MKNQTLTVLMCMRNAAGTLKESLNSLLTQTFKDYKIVLVNDGSTDDSAAVAKSFKDTRLKVIHQRAAGITTALNHGLEHCKTNFVARADADDISEPDRFRIQLNFLNTRVDLAGVGSDMRSFGANRDRIFFPNMPEDVAADMIFNSSLAQPSMMLRRKCLDNGYPMNAAEDYALWFRLIGEGARFASLPRVLVHYRVHASQAHTNPKIIIAADEIKKKWVMRLGITPSFDDMYVHCGKGKGLIYLDKTALWFKRLQSENLRRQVFESEAFSRALARRWIAICVANRSCGFKMFKRYCSSQWMGKEVGQAITRYTSLAWGRTWQE